MGYTYSLGCAQCKVHIWIAQGSPQRGITIYTGKPETMEALRGFLLEHMKHPLIFDDNVNAELSDWDEINEDEES